MARKVHPDYTHQDILDELNKPLLKHPEVFNHYTQAIIHQSPKTDAPFFNAPRMKHIAKDLYPYIHSIDYFRPFKDTFDLEEPSIYTTDVEFQSQPVERLRPFLGAVTIEGIPMIGIAFDHHKQYDGSIIHLSMLYLDPKGFVRAYTPKKGNAMNPLSDDMKKVDSIFGYELLERYGDITAFKAMNRHDPDVQALLYDPEAIEQDIISRLTQA